MFLIESSGSVPESKVVVSFRSSEQIAREARRRYMCPYLDVRKKFRRSFGGKYWRDVYVQVYMISRFQRKLGREYEFLVSSLGDPSDDM